MNKHRKSHPIFLPTKSRFPPPSKHCFGDPSGFQHITYEARVYPRHAKSLSTKYGSFFHPPPTCTCPPPPCWCPSTSSSCSCRRRTCGRSKTGARPLPTPTSPTRPPPPPGTLWGTAAGGDGGLGHSEAVVVVAAVAAVVGRYLHRTDGGAVAPPGTAPGGATPWRGGSCWRQGEPLPFLWDGVG